MVRVNTIITTDGEVDDMNSLIHLCLYLNEINLLGVVYTSSQFHFNGDGIHTLGEITPNYRTSGLAGLERPRTKFGPDPEGKSLKSFRPFPMGWIEKIWDGAYKKAYPYLSQNAEGYPTPEELLSITKVGNIEFEGDVRFDTEGSNLIKKYILDNNKEILYLQSWGGVNTIVRALLSIYEEYGNKDNWTTVQANVVSKIRVLGVNKGVGQDNSWLDNHIPELYPGIQTLWPENLYGTYSGMIPLQPDVSDMFSAEWMTKYIHNGKAELMDEYHLMGDGRRIDGEAEVYQFGVNATLDFGFPNVAAKHFNQYDFIGEGDSNTYIPLLSFGLLGNQNPKYPGLLGCMHVNNEESEVPYNPQTGRYEAYNPFIRGYQEDWAARARWCYQSYSEANHSPIVRINNNLIDAKPLEHVQLTADVQDPDGDDVKTVWEIYPHYNRYSGKAIGLKVWRPEEVNTVFTVPEDAKSGDYFVLILKATDVNKTPMTSYGTVIIRVY